MDEIINAVKEPQEIENRPKWYEDVSLEDAKAIIKANITTAARSFIAIGYYLKHIRDKQLYLEDGHASIWEFAQFEYGISKSTASRYMTMNDRFSDGGNSPNIAEPYQGFGKSQLQEMLALNEEQLEQVTPDMTVLDIRDLARPEDLEEEQVPGQIDITEFPEYLPPDMSVGNMEVYGETSGEAERKTSFTMSLEDMLGGESAVAQEQAERRKSFTMSLEDMLGGEPVKEESEPPIAISQQVVESGRPMEEETLPDESWSIGELPQAKEKYVRNLARVFVEKMGSRLILESFSNVPTDDIIKRKITELDREEGGSVEIEEGILASVGAELIEFFRGGEDLGVCSFARLGTQVRKMLVVKMEQTEPDQEDVIDGEFMEVESPEEVELAKKALADSRRLLNKFLETDGAGDEPIVKKQKIMVDALGAYVRSLEHVEESATELEQPELPLLKNNDQRAAFVDSFETWPLWIETEETGERYYRYDLEDGTGMVVKVYRAMLFDYSISGLSYEERYSEGYGRHEYYLLQPGKFFKDCEANRSTLIEKLKEIQRRNHGTNKA